MAWSRSELSAAGFFYEEDLQSPLPPHVKSLGQSMLDFACQDQGPPSEECIQIQYLASKNSDGEYDEKIWEDLFRQNFFDVLLNDTSVSQDISRRVSRSNYYYDAIRPGNNALWTTFREKVEGHQMKTLPKADFVFYLPMYHLAAESPIPRITDHRGREWNKEPVPSLVESFSWSTLKELYMHGLRPSPFKVFGKDEPREADLNCYPWLIVEHKSGKKSLSESQRSAQLETACCQALNASACAVKLNQIAARYAVELRKQMHIPPIPAVTTVGSKVSVWITYYAEGFMAYHREGSYESYRRRNQGYMMQRIWEGDMTEIRDIREFQLILENTYTWAMRVFKPQINGFIEHWRATHCSIKSTPLRRSTTSTTSYTESEGRSVQDSMGPPSARSSARPSTRSSIGPPPSIRSSMGPPSRRSLTGPVSGTSSRGQASVCSSVDPLLDPANNDDWGYAPQQNVRQVFPDTCPTCQRTRKFFHNCHV